MQLINVTLLLYSVELLDREDTRASFPAKTNEEKSYRGQTPEGSWTDKRGPPVGKSGG